MSLRKMFFDSMNNALDNGYDLFGWSAKEIASDIKKYDADFENVPVSDILPIAGEWLDLNPDPVVIESVLITQGITEVAFDRMRHLVVQPFSIDRLHRAAKAIGIKKHWFHGDHYDVPKQRTDWFNRVKSKDGFFRERTPREILAITRGRSIRG